MLSSLQFLQHHRLLRTKLLKNQLVLSFKILSEDIKTFCHFRSDDDKWYGQLFCVKTSGGSRGGRRGHSSPPPPRKKKRERGGVRSSVPLLSIPAFIHSPVKCNKSLYIFTRCFALLVYLITFELLKQSTFNQKTK